MWNRIYCLLAVFFSLLSSAFLCECLFDVFNLYNSSVDLINLMVQEAESETYMQVHCYFETYMQVHCYFETYNM